MKKILFPTDFSPAAHKAFAYAISIAKKADSRVDVIHVYPEPGKGKELYMDPKELRDGRKMFQKDMKKKMAEFIKPYDANAIGSQVVFPSDETTNKIIEFSDHKYDLIIMGTKGERNALNKIMGSITTKTMMNAHCPVLAVPTDTEIKDLKTITYSTSLKEKDDTFLKSLSEFADLFGASIEYLHVVDNSENQAIANLKAKGLSADSSNVHLVKNTSVLNGVDDFLKEHQTDVLALFIPKRTFLDKLFHKSVTKKLTFYAGIPLFVVNEK
ncbi:universal stress protein [Tamlana crocina]